MIQKAILISAIVCLCVFGSCSSTGGGSDLEKAEAPVFSPDGGHYEGTTSVTMSCATPGAVIRYTTDGQSPTSESSLYSGPVTINDTVIIRAVAVKTDMADSDVAVSAQFYIKKWRVVGSPGISLGEARHTDIAVGSDNLPCIIYSDSGDSWKAYAKKFNGSSWAGLGTIALSAGAANYSSITVHGTNVYTAFQDTSASVTKDSMLPPDVITGALSWNGSTWTALGAPTDQIAYTSIAIGSDGMPFIVYQDLVYSMVELRGVACRYAGSSWTVMSGYSFSDPHAYYTDIAIDADDIPFVVYKDGESPVAGKATVKKWEGGSYWPEVGATGFSSGTADYTTIAVDTAGTPYVAYKDGSVGGKATVMKHTGFGTSEWEALGGEGISAGTASYTCIAVDASGNPWTAFRDDGAGGKAVVKKWSGSAWTTVGGGPCSSGAAAYQNIALGPNGSFYIIFQDASAAGKATVMRYGE